MYLPLWLCGSMPGDAVRPAVPVGCHARPSAPAMAQSLSALAHRNLRWRQGGADRVRKILAVPVAGATTPAGFPELGRGDGRQRAVGATQETVAGRQRVLDSRPLDSGPWTSSFEPRPLQPYRCSMGTQGCPTGGPTYSERGRISRLLAYCSRKCAVQPVIRLIANTGVNRSMGIPSTW